MKPYFETDNGTLYHGDCLEVMQDIPDGSVDLVLTDPPYELTADKVTDSLPNIFIPTLFNIFFPKFNKRVSESLDLSELSLPADRIALLNLMNWTFWKEPGIGVPESTIDFYNDVVGWNEEVKDTNKPTVTTPDRELMDKLDTHRIENGNGFFLKLRRCVNFSLSDGARCGISQFGFGSISMFVVIPFHSCFASFLRSLSCTKSSGLSEVIRLLNDPLALSESHALVMTSRGAELRAIFTFDLANGSAKLSPATSTSEVDAVFEIVCPENVGAILRTSSLSSMFKAYSIGLVGGGADGAFSINFHNFMMPHINKKSSGFMGKKWDASGIAYNVDLWKEALRVLKPGGHLLSFGGTRTYHRMAVAIEDAGFIIRDMLEWIYASLSEDTEVLTINGWERYHKTIDKSPVLCFDIAKDEFMFDKPQRSFCYENKHTAYRIQSDYTDQIVSRNHRVIVEQKGRKVFKEAQTLERQENIPFLESLSDLPETIYDFQSHTSIEKQDLLTRVHKQDIAQKTPKADNASDREEMPCLWEDIQDKKSETGKVLLNKMQRKSKSERFGRVYQGKSSQVDRGTKTKGTRRDDWREKSCVERWSNLFQEKRKLFADKICQMSERVFGNGTGRRLYYGTSLDYGSEIRPMFIKDRGCSSYQSQFTGQQNRESSVVCFKQTPQITRSTITPIEYKGNVWCVEVPTGAFVARRNGKIFITGNSGFPKSQNVGKAYDKKMGNEREIVGKQKSIAKRSSVLTQERTDAQAGMYSGSVRFPNGIDLTKGNSPWEGFGTALKPAHENICLAQKPFNNRSDLCYIIDITGDIKLCLSKLFVRIAEKNSASNQQEQKEVADTVQWLAEKNINTLEDLLEVTDMLPSRLMESLNLSIVLSWLNILADLWQAMNIPIIKTELNLTTELRILKSMEWANILANITQAKNNKTDGWNANVCNVASILNVVKLKLIDIHPRFAQEGVISREAIGCQDVGGKTPAHEPIVLARKPLSEKTIVENCIKHGTGALDIDSCRIPTNPDVDDKRLGGKGDWATDKAAKKVYEGGYEGKRIGSSEQGRFPANLLVTDDALNDGETTGGGKKLVSFHKPSENTCMSGANLGHTTVSNIGDSGSKSRYFCIDTWGEKHGLIQCPKASKSERNKGCEGLEEKLPVGGADKWTERDRRKGDGITAQPRANHHPTVKPLHLMSWLIRLASKEGDTVLDPFAGTGTVLVACEKLNRKWVGVEISEEYCEVSARRIEAESRQLKLFS